MLQEIPFKMGWKHTQKKHTYPATQIADRVKRETSENPHGVVTKPKMDSGVTEKTNL